MNSLILGMTRFFLSNNEATLNFLFVTLVTNYLANSVKILVLILCYFMIIFVYFHGQIS